MSFQKILCATDFSPGSEHALRVAVRLAVRSQAELVIAHVWHVPVLAFANELTFPADTLMRMIDDDKRGLTAALGEATRLGAPRVTTRLLTGVPWEQITETLQAEPAFDLVVMGTHGRTGMARVLLGSVAEKVVRHAPCSVLAVRGRGDVVPFRHVLCPVDFSESSHNAVELAATLVEPGGDGIQLLHAIELPMTYSGDPLQTNFLVDLDRRATHQLEQWASKIHEEVAVPVVTRAMRGGPAAQALSALEDDPTFDLVVTGSHGRTGLQRVLLGSVAETIVRHAPCPVLVARAARLN
jgi:nucleotide-binding universal stress UspA family protein